MEKIAKLIENASGISIPSEKYLMIHSRLKPRVMQTGHKSLLEYHSFLSSKTGQSEIENAISCITTNVSSFFREDHHLEMMMEYAARATPQKELLIWSAGCSQGQEPYSICMALGDKYKYRILATDIDIQVLSFAKTGKYKADMLKNVSEDALSKNFLKLGDSETEDFSIRGEVKKKVIFKRLNLLSDWPLRSKFDLVFCRNVVIYFDASVREKLWPRFARTIKPNGLFFLGHSERVVNCESYGFESCGPTSYRRTSV